MPPKRPLHVLIAGAGVGGLCLAQGLRRSGIDVAVYDRDESVYFRGQGWRLTIQDDGAEALRDCLPAELFALCLATALRPATRLVVTDHRLAPRFAKPLPEPVPDRQFGVNRLTLREILLAGLDDIVHFGKTLLRYEETGDGRVTAHFADGTTATGDLLVGAEGVNSAVRAQLVPDAVVDDMGRMIYGRSPLTEETLHWLPEELVDTFNVMSGPGGVTFGAVTCRAAGDTGAAVAAHAPYARLTPIPHYLAWSMRGWSGAPELEGERFRRADGESLHRLALETLERDGWHPAAIRIVREADVAATFPVGLHSARPLPQWKSDTVTLLGDAAHAMSPARGEGANTTLRDAWLLRHALAEVVHEGTPLAVAKARYEAEMLEYGFEAVARSRERPLFHRGTR
ncbi:2-polyprenyl-6-methoxyphenol hydroxylase-like FAD-dependent oxidoreductase [Thermocatellispora tengchongensis]|uniref:2-polyprenyl-6-methoxyphenol hydroxylase-like FAD-dependent oxidoreductase n=1 Tax=Thermocatellispora tengchongensis TaxID=1073253 RepID=A0A840PUM7_9ACTN|nr:NAD(P)/FAD-dependent oxidoreductase [Thermocatellispora tengchongensis]MBB5139605.1 2-polyprenyl-6-methoxyphenol hydroxylase-like FAD-dependent oxidoreductase [Thermocatellispora tengchongensis]